MKKKVLLLYTDKYYLIKQVYPLGLDVMANHLRSFGYTVHIGYPFLPDPDVETNLADLLERHSPDFIGLGIRNLDTCMSCETHGDYSGEGFCTFFFLPHVKQIVDTLKHMAPDIPLIVGGGAFSISPIAIMDYLQIEHGVIGPGEEPLLRFVEAFPDAQRLSEIPGLIHAGKRSRLPSTGRPNRCFHRDTGFSYAFETVGIPVQLKRGCNQRCSYCVEPLIEGTRCRYRLKEGVIEELRFLSEKHPGAGTVFFVDTELNVPNLSYPTALIRTLLNTGLERRFQFSAQLLPHPFTRAFASLLADAGFSIILTCDSFSDPVLEANGMSYRKSNILETLDLCNAYDLDCTISMVFGLPGETFETIEETLEMMNRYGPGIHRRYEYTIGARIYLGTRLCQSVERGEGEGFLYGKASEGYLEPFYFCTPAAPLEIQRVIEAGLGYRTAYENAYTEEGRQALSLSLLVDHGEWEKAVTAFTQASLEAQFRAYDYLFRKLADTDRVGDAKEISEHFLRVLAASGEPQRYRDRADVIRFYLGCLG